MIFGRSSASRENTPNSWLSIHHPSHFFGFCFEPQERLQPRLYHACDLNEKSRKRWQNGIAAVARATGEEKLDITTKHDIHDMVQSLPYPPPPPPPPHLTLTYLVHTHCARESVSFLRPHLRGADFENKGAIAC
jgi:hypothetical protein